MSEESVTIAFYTRDCTLKKQCQATKKKFTHLLYLERNCFSNCVKNMMVLETLAGCELELMAGSFGLCMPSPIWYEWGGSEEKLFHTVKEFRACEVTGLPSVHFWLESEDGKIWDVLDPYILEIVAPTHRKTIDTRDFVHGCLIAGKTREELVSRGLQYVPAPPLVQEILVKIHASSIRFQTLP
jgi:hypothetical protein